MQTYKIARVFPRKTSFSPTDEHAYFGPPPLFPKYDEAYVSTVFTWDRDRSNWLQKQWGSVCRTWIGGPAFDDCGYQFEPGLFVKRGIVFTSRGCYNKCGFCLVPRREGRLRELATIAMGNNIADNNFLACSLTHKNKVMDMLKTQKDIIFSGGIDAELVDDWFVDRLKEIKLKRMYLALDYPENETALIEAVDKLKHYRRETLGCYVLIGWHKNGTGTIDLAMQRLKRAWEIGTMPYAMLYQPPQPIQYTREWKHLARQFSRPAITKAVMAGVYADNQ